MNAQRQKAFRFFFENRLRADITHEQNTHEQKGTK